MGFVEGGIKWKYLHFHFLHSLFIEITQATLLKLSFQNLLNNFYCS